MLHQIRTLLKQGWCKSMSASLISESELKNERFPKLAVATNPANPQAKCWCITGAIRRTNTGVAYEVTEVLYRAVPPNARKMCFCHGERWAGLQIWNDDPKRKKDDVLKLVDRAIKNVEKMS